jgi:dihydrofolate reductase
VTRQPRYRAQGATTASSVEDALRQIAYPPPAFVIGGGELYRAALPLAMTAYVTEIGEAFAGDTTFPPLTAKEWIETTREEHHGGGGLPFAFVVYTRV